MNQNAAEKTFKHLPENPSGPHWCRTEFGSSGGDYTDLPVNSFISQF